MQDVLKTFVQGIVTIGVITALFANGRRTTQGITATFGGASKLLGTAIRG